MSLTRELAATTLKAGFDVVAMGPLAPPSSIDCYRAWLAKGYHGEMAYMARPDAVAKRENLQLILPGTQATVSVGVNYHSRPLPSELGDDPARGIVAGFARGDDYHDILLARLLGLEKQLDRLIGGKIAVRAYVDTGPVLERDLAVHAGLGFVGKNTNLISPRLGSWLLLGELLVAADLPRLVSVKGIAERVGADSGRGTCGECLRCLKACPTGALVAPYILDARRCISYLTIELKGAIPKDLRPLIANHIFGCDICQEVCPWNLRFARETTDSDLRAPGASEGTVAPHLLELLELDDAAFRQRFRGSPIKRAKRRGLLRNVCVALGNWGEPAAVLPLAHRLADAEPLIRGHAAWALGQIGTQAAADALGRALGDETEAWVREEIFLALQAI